MPYIVFGPRSGEKDASGWPVEVIGDGFIRLYFWQEKEEGAAAYRCGYFVKFDYLSEKKTDRNESETFVCVPCARKESHNPA
jgi:hypothetical protein